MGKKVAIIILTYNQPKLLEICINSIKRKTNYKNYKIFVIDNHSKERIGKRIKEKFQNIRVIINKENFGFSKGNNIGMEIAKKGYKPDYFLILNDDTEFVHKNWLKKLIETSESDSSIGIVGCKLIYPDGKMQNAGGFIKKWEITKLQKIREKDFVEVDHIMGAFMLVKKDVVNKIGGFDEIFSPYLLEDTDYCLRAKKEGFKIKSFGGVEVIHKKGQSFKEIKDPKLFFRFKNDILFSRRHLKARYFLFRIFIYLPLVALFKKNRDEDSLRFKNFKLRKKFLFNFWYLLKAYLFLLNCRGLHRKCKR